MKQKWLFDTLSRLTSTPLVIWKAWRAKQKVFEMRFGTYETSYDNLPSMLSQVTARNTGSFFRAYLTWYLPRTRVRLVFVDTHPQPHQARPQDGYGRHHVEALAGAVSLLIIFAYIYIYINIHKIIHMLITVPLLNGCSFAFATWWRRTARLTWQGYVPDPQWPSLSRQGHGRGSVISCVR